MYHKNTPHPVLNTRFNTATEQVKEEQYQPQSINPLVHQHRHCFAFPFFLLHLFVILISRSPFSSLSPHSWITSGRKTVLKHWFVKVENRNGKSKSTNSWMVIEQEENTNECVTFFSPLFTLPYFALANLLFMCLFLFIMCSLIRYVIVFISQVQKPVTGTQLPSMKRHQRQRIRTVLCTRLFNISVYIWYTETPFSCFMFVPHVSFRNQKTWRQWSRS